ncbi:MAG: histidine kinase [Amylibacter sp.]|nr:histidine kinase [Amylibacter sp.]
MNGKPVMIALLSAAVVAGAGLWYSIERAYYFTVTDVTGITVNGTLQPVSAYQGIDADTSPLKMRACFKVNWAYTPSDDYKDSATPLRAPRSFDCYNGEQITHDLESGGATAILANENKPYGFDTYIAQYADGRAYMWRQINDCGEAQFSGNDLPKDCPNPAE